MEQSGRVSANQTGNLGPLVIWHGMTLEVGLSKTYCSMCRQIIILN